MQRTLVGVRCLRASKPNVDVLLRRAADLEELCDEVDATVQHLNMLAADGPPPDAGEVVKGMAGAVPATAAPASFAAPTPSSPDRDQSPWMSTHDGGQQSPRPRQPSPTLPPLGRPLGPSTHTECLQEIGKAVLEFGCSGTDDGSALDRCNLWNPARLSQLPYVTQLRQAAVDRFVLDAHPVRALARNMHGIGVAHPPRCGLDRRAAALELDVDFLRRVRGVMLRVYNKAGFAVQDRSRRTSRVSKASHTGRRALFQRPRSGVEEEPRVATLAQLVTQVCCVVVRVGDAPHAST